jgi:TolB-like protein
MAAGGVLAASITAFAWQGVVNSRKVEVAPTTTIAMLPFDALDSDPDTVRMASVVPRDMADQFSRGGISMTAPAWSMTYAGDAKARAGAELGADLLVDGTVKRQGNKAHISVSLYHARRGVTLWSTEVTAEPGDTLVDERLSALMARVVSWPAPLDILNSDRPNAVEEARTFLRILQLAYNDGDSQSALPAAEQFAREAPDLIYARSSAAIQTIGAIASASLPPEKRQDALSFARKEAAETMKLGPRNGAAYLTASLVADPSRWAERIDLLSKGIEADPQFTRLQNNLAVHLLQTGALRDALAGAQKAKGQEPLSAGRQRLLASASLANEEFPTLKNILDEFEQLWPEDRTLAALRLRTLIWLESWDAAAAVLDGLAPPGSAAAASRRMAAMKALIAARRSGTAGDGDVARICSEIPSEPLTHDLASTCMFAGGVLGRPDISFAAAKFLLPRIHNSPDGEDAWIRLREPDAATHANELFLPWTASMRADPQIIEVFERLGLLDYWRTTKNWPDFCDSAPEPAAAPVCEIIMKGNQ